MPALLSTPLFLAVLVFNAQRSREVWFFFSPHKCFPCLTLHLIQWAVLCGGRMSRCEWGFSNVGYPCEMRSLSHSRCYQLLTGLTEQMKYGIESWKPNYSLCSLKQCWFFYVQFSQKSMENMNLCFGQTTNGTCELINSIFQQRMERGR